MKKKKSVVWKRKHFNLSGQGTHLKVVTKFQISSEKCTQKFNKRGKKHDKSIWHTSPKTNFNLQSYINSNTVNLLLKSIFLLVE